MLIDSPSNSTVKSLHALANARSRRETRLFLVEGVRLMEDALAAGFEPKSCLYAPSLLERTNRGRALLGQLSRFARQPGRGVFEASERALAAATETVHPQGVVASFAMPDWQVPASEGAPPLALVCDDIQDPGNLGTILRTAEGAGVGAVWLSQGCVDLYSPKVVRASMRAHFRLPAFPDKSWADIEAGLAGMGIPRDHVYAAEAEAPHTYDEVDWSSPAALIVSNEAHGLSDEARELATATGGLLSIPMQGGTESLNAAVACAIILFEAARQRRVATARSGRRQRG